MTKHTRGEVREDGRLFWERRATGQELWLWPVAFGLYNAQARARNCAYRDSLRGKAARTASRPTEAVTRRDLRVGERDALGRYFIGYVNGQRKRGRWGSLQDLQTKRERVRRDVFKVNEKARQRRDMARGYCKWRPKTKITRRKEPRLLLTLEQRKQNAAEGRRRWKREYRKKLKCDPVLRAMEQHRMRVRHFIRGRSSSERSGVGCKREFFKAWIAEQFTEGMTWSNYGRVWSIDHILPQSWFKRNAHARRYLMHHYTNLRPLGVFHNGARSDRVTREDLSLFLSRVPDEWREEAFSVVFDNPPVLENPEALPSTSSGT